MLYVKYGEIIYDIFIYREELFDETESQYVALLGLERLCRLDWALACRDPTASAPECWDSSLCLVSTGGVVFKSLFILLIL